jgi:hypothetical protein
VPPKVCQCFPAIRQPTRCAAVSRTPSAIVSVLYRFKTEELRIMSAEARR